MVRWVVKSIPNGGATELFYIPANALRLCHPVCGMVLIKEPSPLTEKR